MGIKNFFKKHFFEEIDEELNVEELNDLVEDSEEYETARFSKKKSVTDKIDEGEDGVGVSDNTKKRKTSKRAKKERNVQEEREFLRDEEAKYDNMLNTVHAEELNKALDITDKDVRLRSFEKVEISNYSSEDINNYVVGQCEIMEESIRHIDAAMEQYSDVAEHFSDIEKLEAAPDVLKREIAHEAERVDNLTVDRRIYKANESKLSNSTYRLMEQYEDEIPKKITFIENQESYFENVKQDMRAVEGEQMALRMEARILKRRQLNIKHASMATLICMFIVFSIFVIAMVATEDETNMVLFITVTVLSAILALGMYAILKNTQRNVMATEIKLNKTTSMLNKIKIRYVNAINVLDFEYEKYKITNAYELSRKYEAYLEMKQEQKNVLDMTTKLTQAEERLMALLRQIGMVDCNIWSGQVRALYNHSEMVEIRHEYAVQRQKLRDQIAFNESRVDEAKKNIKLVTKKYPNLTGDILKIIDKYEKRSRKLEF
ncbi:MAG: hypothetical protein IJB96_09470 [Lachnospira sp.]|nr:hypothetical protein [Lachnospira sp.]